MKQIVYREGVANNIVSKRYITLLWAGPFVLPSNSWKEDFSTVHVLCDTDENSNDGKQQGNNLNLESEKC